LPLPSGCRLDANGDGTVSYQELMNALRGAEVTRTGAGPAQQTQAQRSLPSSTSVRRPNPAAAGQSWELEPMSWEGRNYLWDRRTNAVYADNGENQYPELVGRWQVCAAQCPQGWFES
jgi:hypothetical protein